MARDVGTRLGGHMKMVVQVGTWNHDLEPNQGDKTKGHMKMVVQIGTSSPLPAGGSDLKADTLGHPL